MVYINLNGVDHDNGYFIIEIQKKVFKFGFFQGSEGDLDPSKRILNLILPIQIDVKSIDMQIKSNEIVL